VCFEIFCVWIITQQPTCCTKYRSYSFYHLCAIMRNTYIYWNKLADFLHLILLSIDWFPSLRVFLSEDWINRRFVVLKIVSSVYSWMFFIQVHRQCTFSPYFIGWVKCIPHFRVLVGRRASHSCDTSCFLCVFFVCIFPYF